MKLKQLWLTSLVFVSSAWVAYAADLYSDWSRSLVDSTPGKHLFLRNQFYVSLTGSRNELLHVLCRYHLDDGSTGIMLRGSRNEDGDFWPAVSLQVSNNRRASWTPIGQFNPTVNPEFLTVDRQNPSKILWVAAEPFRSFIGTKRWGRISLIDDKPATAVFALEDLLPPRGRRPEEGDFKEVLGDREKREFGSAAVLRHVVSIQNQLTGEFTWVIDRLPGAVKGAQTTAGDFWPTAVLQVGDSDGQWETVGETKSMGRTRSMTRPEHIFGEPFRINLEPFKAHLNGKKFGKVIFSNSTYSVFVLNNIDPRVADN
ncbi:MAG: hypothetical protein WAO00_05880 [Chthoniobacterales bacterium]